VKDKRGIDMNTEVQELKEKLLSNQISVADLSSKEVKVLTEELKKDLSDKQKELNDINKKIKDVKVKIDNWNKN
jgi:flagellar hook assembly protein FlgD